MVKLKFPWQQSVAHLFSITESLNSKCNTCVLFLYVGQIVLFLKRTLKEQLFNLELMRRRPAVDQYMSYLKAHYNTREYEHMLQ